MGIHLLTNVRKQDKRDMCPYLFMFFRAEDGYVSVKVKFGNGESYTYYRTEDEIQQRGLAGVIDYLFTHLSEFPDMTQQEFIDHLSADLDKRFGYNDIN